MTEGVGVSRLRIFSVEVFIYLLVGMSRFVLDKGDFFVFLVLYGPQKKEIDPFNSTATTFSRPVRSSFETADHSFCRGESSCVE